MFCTWIKINSIISSVVTNQSTYISINLIFIVTMAIIWDEQTEHYDPDAPVNFAELYNEEGYEIQELDITDKMGLGLTLGDFVIPLAASQGKNLIPKSKILASPSRKTQGVSPEFCSTAFMELLKFQPKLGVFDIWTEIRALSQYPPFNGTSYVEKIAEINKLLTRLANYFRWTTVGDNDIYSMSRKSEAVARAISSRDVDPGCSSSSPFPSSSSSSYIRSSSSPSSRSR